MPNKRDWGGTPDDLYRQAKPNPSGRRVQILMVFADKLDALVQSRQLQSNAPQAEVHTVTSLEEAHAHLAVSPADILIVGWVKSDDYGGIEASEADLERLSEAARNANPKCRLARYTESSNAKFGMVPIPERGRQNRMG